MNYQRAMSERYFVANYARATDFYQQKGEKPNHIVVGLFILIA